MSNYMEVLVEGKLEKRRISHYKRPMHSDTSVLDIPTPIPVMSANEELRLTLGGTAIIVKLSTPSNEDIST